MQNTVSKSGLTNKLLTVLILLKKRPIFSILISVIGFIFLFFLLRNIVFIWMAEQVVWHKYQRHVSIQALDIRFISPAEITLSVQDFVLTDPHKNTAFAQFASLSTTLSFDLFQSVIKVSALSLDKPKINLWQDGKKDNFSDLIKSDAEPSRWQILCDQLHIRSLNLTYTRPDQFRKPLVLSGNTTIKNIQNQWHIIFQGQLVPLTPLHLNASYQQDRLMLHLQELDLRQLQQIQVNSASQEKQAAGMDLGQLQTQLQTVPITGNVLIDQLKITSDMTLTNLSVDLNKNK